VEGPVETTGTFPEFNGVVLVLKKELSKLSKYGH